MIARRDHFVDHALQPELRAVLRRENSRDAIRMKLRDFGGYDHAAATAKNLDVSRAGLFQHVDHVFEIFDMATLVRRHRDAVRVFLQSGVDDFFHAAVVSEVNHLAAAGLDDAAHDVDRCVVPVKEASGRYEANLVLRFVDEVFGVQIRHEFSPAPQRAPCAELSQKNAPS